MIMIARRAIERSKCRYIREVRNLTRLHLAKFLQSMYIWQKAHLLDYVRFKNCSFLFDFHFLGPSEAFRQKWIPSRCQLPIFRRLR